MKKEEEEEEKAFVIKQYLKLKAIYTYCKLGFKIQTLGYHMQVYKMIFSSNNEISLRI